MQLTNLGYQSLEVGKAGTESTIANALTAATSFGFDEAGALTLVGEVRAVVERWREVFRELGVDAELERRVDATLTSRLRQAFG